MISMHYRVYRAFRSVYLFFVLGIFPAGLLFLGSVASADTDLYADRLVATAEGRGLSRDRYWDILVHYKGAGDGRESLVDDPAFFLAADGKKDPAAELSATIRGFFEDPARGDGHPRCRFPARYAWLKDQLGIDEAYLPVVVCAKYEESLSHIKMQSAVLVFPAAHGNGPASMFGHTLIRIGSTFQSELMSYAVNYAAQGENDNSLVYTFKGLFGYYKGYYSILPYYEKVKEYNNIEHRDIWEYELNLNEDEIRRMVMHIWELRETYSDYYFFTENCSYNLLFLLEAARPALDLTTPYRARVRFWVIPSDTIRAVVDSGVVKQVKYRPSQATRVSTLSSAMAAENQKLTLRVARQNMAPAQVGETGLTPGEKAQVLELAAEYLQYRFSRKELTREEYLKQYLAVLKERSAFPGTAEKTNKREELPAQPDWGHLPGKMAAGGGWRSAGNRAWYAELEWRPAYHDLLDPGDGYVEGAQINFFDIRGRYFPEDDSLKLQSFHLIDILSLAPRDRFFLPVSWKVMTGFDRIRMGEGTDNLIYRLNLGGGAAYQNRGLGTAFVMMESDFQFSNVYDDRFAFGIGSSAGVYAKLSKQWNASLSATALFYPLGETHRTLRGMFRQNWVMNRNNTIECGISREKTFRLTETDIRLAWNRYF